MADVVWFATDHVCFDLLPVVVMADRMAAGLHLGWRVFKRPTTPETWGHDIEVPDTELKRTRRVSKS